MNDAEEVIAALGFACDALTKMVSSRRLAEIRSRLERYGEQHQCDEPEQAAHHQSIENASGGI